MHHTDLLMVGCGPSNLAVGVALEECSTPHNITSSLILEKDDAVCWHKGLLFPDAQSQVSFLKDLVTQRDPTSRYSFLNFLHKTGRLDGFINLQTFTPYRKEISDYLQWVADNLKKTRVIYNCRVSAVVPDIASNGQIAGWKVSVENGETYRANRLIYGAGRDLNIPAIFKDISTDKVIHSANFLTTLEKMDKRQLQNIAVIGGAQSSAEMYQYCIENMPDARISMIMRSIGLVNYEGSLFTNTLYQNDYINTYFNSDDETRLKTLAAMHTTNYSGVAPATLSELYRFHYLQNLRAEDRATMLTQCELLHAEDDENGVLITWKDNKTGNTQSARFDIVLLGTGYKNQTPALFHTLSKKYDIKQIHVDRNYRAILPCMAGVSLHLQGVNEKTHGIADSLLSVLACRSKEIVDDITH